MLIKIADDHSEMISALEQAMNGGGPNAKRSRDEFYIRSAGLKGEKDSAYLIDFDYAQSSNWAVIHDLRLEHKGRTAQIDHVLINRWMDVYVLETKHFHAGLKITDDGEFLRWNNYRRTFEGMASPLEQNERHIQVLKDVLGLVEFPTRLGVRIAPNFQSFVLVAPAARIDRPKRFDASRVIKADQLKKSIWRDFDGENPLLGLLKTAAKIVSGETVEYVARQLASRHAPLTRKTTDYKSPVLPPAAKEPALQDTDKSYPKARIEPTMVREALPRSQPPALPACPASVPVPGISPANASCKSCGMAAGSILYGKYGYYLKCDACAANTSIKLTCHPSHSPRLRKDGNDFYRECADCGVSTLFHRNQANGPAR